MRRRWIPYVLMLVFLWTAGPVMAIDSKPAKDDDKDKQAAQQTDPNAKKTGDAKASSGQTSQKKSLWENLKRDVEKSKGKKPDKFDNYVDKNRDGVDDRVKRPAAAPIKQQPNIKKADAPKRERPTPQKADDSNKKEPEPKARKKPPR